jgi:hypothetical protein
MTEIHPELLAFLFNINYEVVKQQTDGLSHEDSLLQLPFRGNCLNWVLGHLIISRDSILKVLEETEVWSEEIAAPYLREADPITAENNNLAQPLENILTAFDLSHQRLMAAFERITPEDLAAPKSERSSIGKWIAFLQFHESYHVGQTELLRQLAGKNDKVI